MSARTYRIATAQVLRKNPGLSGPDLDEAVNELVQEWAEDAAYFGAPEDSPSLEAGRDNCDDYGTGEGQFHGRIG